MAHQPDRATGGPFHDDDIHPTRLVFGKPLLQMRRCLVKWTGREACAAIKCRQMAIGQGITGNPAHLPDQFSKQLLANSLAPQRRSDQHAAQHPMPVLLAEPNGTDHFISLMRDQQEISILRFRVKTKPGIEAVKF